MHSNNCRCNDEDPGGKPDEIEDLAFALSGQGLLAAGRKMKAQLRDVHLRCCS